MKLIETIPISQCKVCFNDLKLNNLHELLHKNISICPKCLYELNPKITYIKFNGLKGLYLYTYNDKIKEKIYTFKGCNDIELSSIFLNYFLLELKLMFKGYYIVPSPSDENANNNRGFNHVKEMFKSLNLKMIDCLYKKEAFKQSDLSKNEREKVSEKIGIKDIKQLRNKKILFVDDIFTTGSTLKACTNLLKKGLPKKIKFLVVAKVISND